MGIKLGNFQICPMELITDDNGKLAAAKIWMQIAYGVLTWKVIFMEGITWDIMTAYGSIVGGSFIAAKLISMKYSGPQPDVTVNQPEKVNIAGNAVIKKGKK